MLNESLECYKAQLALMLECYTEMPPHNQQTAIQLLEDVLSNFKATQKPLSLNFKEESSIMGRGAEGNIPPDVTVSTFVMPLIKLEDESHQKSFDYHLGSDTDNEADVEPLTKFDHEEETTKRKTSKRKQKKGKPSRRRREKDTNALKIKTGPCKRKYTGVRKKKSGHELKGSPKTAEDLSVKRPARKRKNIDTENRMTKKRTLPKDQYDDLWEEVSKFLEPLTTAIPSVEKEPKPGLGISPPALDMAPAPETAMNLTKAESGDQKASADVDIVCTPDEHKTTTFEAHQDLRKKGNATDFQHKSNEVPENPSGLGRFYKCNICNHTARRPYIQYHVLNHHAQHLKPYICTECEKRFARPSQLKKHVLIHSRVPKYLCDQCMYITHTPDLLRMHNSRFHCEDTRTYECSKCDFTTKFFSSLKEHESRHTGVKNFPCTVCGKAFAAQSGRARHMHLHEEPKHICEICGKKFHLFDKLQLHKLVHSGIKAHNCHLCSYQCNIRTNLVKHVKNVHKVNVSLRRCVQETKGNDNNRIESTSNDECVKSIAVHVVNVPAIATVEVVNGPDSAPQPTSHSSDPTPRQQPDFECYTGITYSTVPRSLVPVSVSSESPPPAIGMSHTILTTHNPTHVSSHAPAAGAQVCVDGYGTRPDLATLEVRQDILTSGIASAWANTTNMPNEENQAVASLYASLPHL